MERGNEFSSEASGSFYCVFIIWLIYSYEENYSICTYAFNTIKLTEAGYGGVGYIINRFARPCSCKFNIHTRHTRVRRIRIRIQSRIKNPTRWLLVRQSHRLKPSSTYQTPSSSTVVNPFSLAKHNREIGKLNR